MAGCLHVQWQPVSRKEGFQCSTSIWHVMHHFKLTYWFKCSWWRHKVVSLVAHSLLWMHQWLSTAERINWNYYCLVTYNEMACWEVLCISSLSLNYLFALFVGVSTIKRLNYAPTDCGLLWFYGFALWTDFWNFSCLESIYSFSDWIVSDFYYNKLWLFIILHMWEVTDIMNSCAVNLVLSKMMFWLLANNKRILKNGY